MAAGEQLISPVRHAFGFAERRREPRVAVDAIPAVVTIGAEKMEAQIRDISLSGMRMRVECSVAVGAEVTVTFQNTIAAGRIRYSQRDPAEECFQVGVQIEDVLNRA